MYCMSCGRKNEEASKYCCYCGKQLELVDDNVKNDFDKGSISDNVNRQNNSNHSYFQEQPIAENYANQPYQNTVSAKKISVNQILLYILMGICTLNIILPFCTWVNIPMYDSIYSWFGGQGSISSYSLFTYVSAANTYADDIVLLISYIMILFVVMAMILDALFIAFGFMKKRFCTVFSMIGSIIMLIMSLLFSLVMNLMSAVSSNVINTTAVPWVSVLTSITGIILTAVIIHKRKANGRNAFV